MEIKIQQAVLQQTLELVSRVSTKHVTLPVLQCVLIEAKGNSVTFTATNLEIGLIVTKPVEVIESGTIAVPAQTLLQTVQYISQKDVILKIEDTTLVVESAKGQTHINTIPFDEFPSIPTNETTTQIINRPLFSLGIKTAAFAASQSSIKPELGSIYVLQKKEHSLTFVATDSFRLMEKTVAQKGVVLEESMLIPQKNALELAKVCDSLEEDPQLSVTENQCALTFVDSGVYITTRLVNGSFPDYNQIIPKEFSTHATVLKNDLATLFKKTNIFLNKFLQVTLTVSDNSLTLTANNGEVGNTTESLTAQTEGDELTLNFNQRYLTEPISHIVDDSIVLHFAGIGRPLIIEGVSDSSFRYLVMPMNK